MSPEDIRKLLGGYATGTLTAEEQQALFAAALEDQDLFDELAREQSLRDLLRDSAVRAELLTALDGPPGRMTAFWQWLRRPAIAGLAAASVLAVAVVAVWQSTRIASVKPQRVMIAELRPQERPNPAAPVPPAANVREPEVKPQAKPRDLPASASGGGHAVQVPQAAAGANVSGARAKVSDKADALAKDAAPAAVAAPPPPPPPPAATPAPATAEKKTEIATAPAPSSQAMTAGALESSAPDARALFHAAPPLPGANAFAPGGGGGSAAPAQTQPEARRTDSAPRPRALSGFAAATLAPAMQRLGMRLSILRANGEADLTTVLDPGETVRLKITPNADGFLSVAQGEGAAVVTPALRFKPQETQELTLPSSGQLHLMVMLSRRRQPAAAFGSVAPDLLVEHSARGEHATYVVASPRQSAAGQVFFQVTLTFR